MIYKEPAWKNNIVLTSIPIFSDKECSLIIDYNKNKKLETAKVGQSQKKRTKKTTRSSSVNFIPFKDFTPMYQRIEEVLHDININNFGYDNMQITEMAQYTQYKKGDFYDWHIDTEINGMHTMPVRKISMSVLLNDEKEYTGGNFEFFHANSYKIKKGHGIFFSSFLSHRVAKVTKGVRKSLVMWFGGTPLR